MTTNGALGKIYPSAREALVDLADGATVLISGFAGNGVPETLLDGLVQAGKRDLVCVCQGAWPVNPAQPERKDVANIVEAGLVKTLISPMPFHPNQGGVVKEKWESGQLEIEVVPPGILAERLRSGGAGIGGVFLPTGVGTRFAEGCEVREIGGRGHVFHPAIKADFALIRAHAADRLGNVVYQGVQRNWCHPMAMAAAVTVAEVDQVVEPGELDPERVITQAIFVNRLVQTI